VVDDYFNPFISIDSEELVSVLKIFDFMHHHDETAKNVEREGNFYFNMNSFSNLHLMPASSLRNLMHRGMRPCLSLTGLLGGPLMKLIQDCADCFANSRSTSLICS